MMQANWKAFMLFRPQRPNDRYAATMDNAITRGTP
jgi:hypothetical protein